MKHVRRATFYVLTCLVLRADVRTCLSCYVLRAHVASGFSRTSEAVAIFRLTASAKATASLAVALRAKAEGGSHTSHEKHVGT